MLDITNEIINKLEYKYILIENAENEKEVKNIYLKELEKGKNENYIPLIIVPSDLILEMMDDYGDRNYNEYKNEILENYNKIDGKEFLKSRWNSEMEDSDEEWREELNENYPFDEKISSDDNFISVIDYKTKKPYENLILIKIPRDKPWEAAAIVPIGAVNYDITPEEQIAVFKYWYEKYKVLPAVVVYDIWEMYLEEKIEDEEEIRNLAREQFAFCPDIIYQGLDEIKNLGNLLKYSKIWYFWWD